MSGRVYVVDAGSSGIRGAVCDVKKKEISVIDTKILELPEFPGELPDRIRQMIEILGGKSSQNIIVSISEGIYVRNMTFPFSDRAKVEPLILYDFGDQLPAEIDDMATTWTYWHNTPNSSLVLCAAASSELVSNIINTVTLNGGDVARLVISAARSCSLAPVPEKYSLIIDIGAKVTELSVVTAEKTVMSRTMFSGIDNIISALSNYSPMDPGSIRNWLITSGTVSDPAPGEEGFEELIREEIIRQAEDWRKFILYCNGILPAKIDNIILTGGGSELNRISEFTSQITGLPASHASIVGVNLPQSWISTVSLAFLEEKYSSDICDFRRGEFARGAGDSLVKRKALTVLLSMMIFFSSLVVSGIFSMKKMETQERDLLGLTALLSKEVLGKRMMDPEGITRTIKKKSKQNKGDLSKNPIPSMSAYTLLGLISKNLPPAKVAKKDEGDTSDKKDPKEEKKDKPDINPAVGKPPLKKTPVDSALKNKEEVVPISEITLDITKIQIKPGKITITGTVEKAQDVDEIIKGLKRIECFQELRPGKIKTVGSKESEKREFTLDITMTCL
ncbi:hypothetical protein KKF34_13005 [Myxococcota bacterium]|nr:hypothetical protein [Myxococcota bacterium]MBU1381885.1 hypothetical protein [Myxococcota bacterium]MBU1497786.1 hypothetical protein [Myxococcota bacterium]